MLNHEELPSSQKPRIPGQIRDQIWLKRIYKSKEITTDLQSMGIEVEGKICNRVSRETVEEFMMKVPEMSGSAKEIVDSVSKEILKSNREMNFFRQRKFVSENIR